jgi:DNA-binding Xre family transcriptional regulator
MSKKIYLKLQELCTDRKTAIDDLSVFQLARIMSHNKVTTFQTVKGYVDDSLDSYNCDILERLCATLGLHIREIIDQDDDHSFPDNQTMSIYRWLDYKIDYFHCEVERLTGDIIDGVSRLQDASELQAQTYQLMREMKVNLETLEKKVLAPIKKLEQEYNEQRFKDRQLIKIDENTKVSQVELAKRLGVAHTTISQRRGAPDFAKWSKRKDPQAIAWKFVRSLGGRLMYYEPILD